MRRSRHRRTGVGHPDDLALTVESGGEERLAEGDAALEDPAGPLVVDPEDGGPSTPPSPELALLCVLWVLGEGAGARR